MKRPDWPLFAVRPFALLACLAVFVGCGGAPETAVRNRTFYDWATGAGGGGAKDEFEKRYPPLDFAEAAQTPEYIGVTIVRGGVRLSRPRNWTIREASNEPGRAYIQYVSPRAYSFAIYERSDSPGDLWRDVLTRYEEDVSSAGAKVVGGRVPVVTSRGQGRAYTVERKVDAAKKPFISHDREILLRGEHRIVLVQIVHEGDDLSGLDQELMRVVATLEAL